MKYVVRVYDQDEKKFVEIPCTLEESMIRIGRSGELVAVFYREDKDDTET